MAEGREGACADVHIHIHTCTYTYTCVLIFSLTLTLTLTPSPTLSHPPPPPPHLHQELCNGPTCLAEESYYGGSPFNMSDPSTHWCEPHQLFTWWKNNVERRSKFKVLQDDAAYTDFDPRKIARCVLTCTCVN